MTKTEEMNVRGCLPIHRTESGNIAGCCYRRAVYRALIDLKGEAEAGAVKDRVGAILRVTDFDREKEGSDKAARRYRDRAKRARRQMERDGHLRLFKKDAKWWWKLTRSGREEAVAIISTGACLGI